jgi:hypothetical protein
MESLFTVFQWVTAHPWFTATIFFGGSTVCVVLYTVLFELAVQPTFRFDVVAFETRATPTGGFYEPAPIRHQLGPIQRPTQDAVGKAHR